MSRFDEHLFGRLAVYNGYLSQEQLQECLDIQRLQGSDERQQIGEILLERGYIDEEQLGVVLDIRRKKLRKMLLDSRELVSTERSFGQQALRLGFVNHAQLEAALLEQQRLRRLNLQLCLGDIMVSQGTMKVEQVLEVLSRQSNRIMFCQDCDSHFTVQAYSAGAEYYCKYCNRVLRIPKFLDTVATDGVLGEEEFESDERNEIREGHRSHETV